MILALDLGSTHFKAGLFDSSLKRLSECSSPTPYSNRENDFFEMEVVDVQNVVIELIRKCCLQADIECNRIKSISVTSQAQSFTLLDDGGRALCAVFSWCDPREDTDVQYPESFRDIDWQQQCGIPALQRQMPAKKLHWLFEHMPGAFEGRFHFVSLPGIVFMLLGKVNLTDQSQAALSGIYSLETNDWMIDIRQLGMPTCLRLGEGVLVKTVCTALDLPAEILLVSAGYDQLAGACGVGCQEGDVVVTLGTAFGICRTTRSRPQSSGTICWGRYFKNHYYEAASAASGGMILDWARNDRFPEMSHEKFNTLLMQGVHKTHLSSGIFETDQSGCASAWQGIFKSDSERAYAVVEGVVFDLCKLIKAFSISADEKVVLTGGGSKSAIYLQMIASCLGRTVFVRDGDGLLGAAKMASNNLNYAGQIRQVQPVLSQHLFFKMRRRIRNDGKSSFKKYCDLKLCGLMFLFWFARIGERQGGKI